MHRVSILTSLAASALIAGCTAPSVLVEVLPPRTSATCAAPARTDAALGRGLLDVTASLGTHGAYVADLRLSGRGDAFVDGFTVEYGLPEGVNNDVKEAADAAAGDLVVGDVALSGSDDDVRVALLQNVQLIPRDLAVALQADTGIEIDKVNYLTIDVTLTPITNNEAIAGAASTFPIDICKGCLVLPPDICSDDGEYAQIPVTCRPGQDTPLFTCVSADVGSEQ
ncbi:MAG TPA: hypothetical protein VGF99_15590 [Myxococcota bacterium]